MFVIATDLDRTLLPNGILPYDGSMERFIKIIRHEKPKLVYVTGRNISEVQEAILEFHAPYPDFVVAEVGTKVYKREGKGFSCDDVWIGILRTTTTNWNIGTFKDELSLLKGLRIQEEKHQNEFKLSYYIDDIQNFEIIVKEATKIIKSICKSASIVFSIDEAHRIGLLDILPKGGTKLSGIEYIRKNEGWKKEDIVYCGDSGNDLLPLTFGYKAIVVGNASDDLKRSVKAVCFQKDCADELYVASGLGKLNGNYVSGIIEGLIRFNLIDHSYSE